MLKAYLKLLNGEMTVVTDTVIMAKEFGLIHKNLLKKARTIASEVLCDSVRRAEHSTRLTDNNNDRTAESPAHLFIDSEYTDSQSKSRPKVILTEEGFYYVVMEISHAKGKEQRELLRKIKRDFVKEFFRLREENTKLHNEAKKRIIELEELNRVNQGLVEVAKINIKYSSPLDNIGHISSHNGEERRDLVRSYVTTVANGNPFSEEDEAILFEHYCSPLMRDTVAKEIVRHAKNQKARNRKRYTASKLYKHFNNMGWLPEKVSYSDTLL